jgi:hypothetical protein
MTIRLKNEMYIEFRDRVAARGGTRVGILRLLIKQFLDEEARQSRIKVR